jgi:hypothetical protein
MKRLYSTMASIIPGGLGHEVAALSRYTVFFTSRRTFSLLHLQMPEKSGIHTVVSGVDHDPAEVKCEECMEEAQSCLE